MTHSAIDLRIHAPADSKPRAGGEFVLYWMQTTHRAHDNFALNFAIEQADALGLPLQVYHGLRHDYPWASDRFHTWILESVVDLSAAFEAKGINYAFWLSRARGQFTEWPAGRRTDVIPRSEATRDPDLSHSHDLRLRFDRGAAAPASQNSQDVRSRRASAGGTLALQIPDSCRLRLRIGRQATGHTAGERRRPHDRQ
jgi:hypothetical protein